MEIKFAKQFDAMLRSSLNDRSVFDDFLTLALASFGRLPGKPVAEDEALYLETMAKYKADPIRFEFPKLLGALICEMEERRTSEAGWDVLGELYEARFGSKRLSQFFTPWPICKFMAEATYGHIHGNDGQIRILDSACGSGRMLMAASRLYGPHAHYYAVDVDPSCVKMTALNFFLSGMFRGEAMCGNPLLFGDFSFSYRTSLLPFGVFRITEKEKSPLWHSLNAQKEKTRTNSPEGPSEMAKNDGAQLTFF